MESNNTNKPSEGFGDTVAKVAEKLGLNTIAESVARSLGKKDCGCNKRKQKLNEMFPYKSDNE
ncbi:hypothetical protein [Microcystis phage Mel-JY01]